MITLSEAFKLCDIKEEMVYFYPINKQNTTFTIHYGIFSKKVREKFDMKKIKVVKIDLEFEHFGSDFRGYLFFVSGISEEELRKNSY